MSNIDTFLQMVKDSDNIVFFGGAGVPRRAVSRTSGAWTDCITRSMITAGDDFKPHVLSAAHGRILPVLPG